jgi:hypothetical protein
MAYLGRDLSHCDGNMSNFRELEEGHYAAEVTETKLTTSRNGNEMIVLDWKILNDQYDGAYVGELFREWIVISGAGQKMGENRLKKILEAIGNENTEYIEDTEELLSKPCIIVIKRKEEKRVNQDSGLETTRPTSRITEYYAIPAVSEEDPEPESGEEVDDVTEGQEEEEEIGEAGEEPFEVAKPAPAAAPAPKAGKPAPTRPQGPQKPFKTSQGRPKANGKPPF